jgi:hypothetical protein
MQSVSPRFSPDASLRSSIGASDLDESAADSAQVAQLAQPVDEAVPPDLFLSSAGQTHRLPATRSNFLINPHPPFCPDTPRGQMQQPGVRPAWLGSGLPVLCSPQLGPAMHLPHSGAQKSFRSPQFPRPRRQHHCAQSALDLLWLKNRCGASLLNTWDECTRGAGAGVLYRRKPIPLIDCVDPVDKTILNLSLDQPTPLGVKRLLSHCLATDGGDPHVGANLPRQDAPSVIEAQACAGQPLDFRINEFLGTIDWSAIKEDGRRIHILMDGEQHAVPCMLESDGAHRWVMVLDSTAGSALGMYKEIASQHTDIQLYLNDRSRQVDAVSCMTDAIEMTLQLWSKADAGQLIRGRKIEKEASTLGNSRLSGLLQTRAVTGNFHLVTLPEFLCFTAQSPSFLKQESIDLSANIVVNKEMTTLQRHLDNSREFARKQLFDSDDAAKRVGTILNCYLYIAAERHAHLLDALTALDRRQKSCRRLLF